MPLSLIADCGASKSDWLLVDQRTLVKHFRLGGLNASRDTMEAAWKLFKSLVKECGVHQLSLIEFYGAGATESKQPLLKNTISEFFPGVEVIVKPDIALLPRVMSEFDPAWFVILGTGSAMSYFEDGEFRYSRPSLGQPFGDEGSGWHLKVEFLKSIIRADFSDKDMSYLERSIGLTPLLARQILDSSQAINEFEISADIWSMTSPNRLAETMVSRALDDALPHLNDKVAPLCFSGSVAHFHRDYLKAYCKQKGLTFGSVIKYPILELKKRYDS